MKIIVVSGGFDPIHSGHIAMLQEAAMMGDIVIAGLNSDEWLTRKKGRPFMKWNEIHDVKLRQCGDVEMWKCENEIQSYMKFDPPRNCCYTFMHFHIFTSQHLHIFTFPHLHICINATKLQQFPIFVS